MLDKIDVVCFGYNGANNTGSEAKLLTTIADVKEVLGERLRRITVLTFNKENQSRYLKDKCPEAELIEVTALITKLDLIEFARLQNLIMFRRPEIVLLSEGSTFIDHFGSGFLWAFCGTLLVQKVKNLHCICYSNDCGNLKPYNQRVLRRTVNQADLIMLRNPDAVARMKKYGVKKEIHCTADGAYAYPLPPEEYQNNLLKKFNIDPEKKPIAGLAPKWFFNWPIAYRPYGPKEDKYMPFMFHTWPKGAREWNARYIQQNAEYADWCIENLNMDIALIAMEHMDRFPTEEIYAKMKHQDRARLILSDDYVVDDIITVLVNLEFLNTTRYHAHVLSSSAGVPTISVSSDTRLEAVHRELGLMDYYNEYVDHADPVPPKIDDLFPVLVRQTESVLEHKTEIRKRNLKGYEKFVERSKQNKILFSQWFKETYG
ncbi:MAG: polysaccharide pyruvyl transferase family protein [Actinomycetota bacterium]|nr:polysaccharide pyruvyl transferase family protein [Actinomycetota bacterium]